MGNALFVSERLSSRGTVYFCYFQAASGNTDSSPGKPHTKQEWTRHYLTIHQRSI